MRFVNLKISYGGAASPFGYPVPRDFSMLKCEPDVKVTSEALDRAEYIVMAGSHYSSPRSKAHAQMHPCSCTQHS